MYQCSKLWYAWWFCLSFTILTSLHVTIGNNTVTELLVHTFGDLVILLFNGNVSTIIINWVIWLSCRKINQNPFYSKKKKICILRAYLIREIPPLATPLKIGVLVIHYWINHWSISEPTAWQQHPKTKHKAFALQHTNWMQFNLNARHLKWIRHIANCTHLYVYLIRLGYF